MKGLMLQELKTLVKSPTSLSLLIIPIILLVGLGFLLPAAWIIPSSITIGIIASVLLYFGGSIEEIKRTSFMKAISLTKLSKLTFLSIKILFAIIVSVFIILWVLLFGWFFSTVVPIMATNFSTILGNASGQMGFIENINFTVQWNDISWGVMFYAGAITIVVTITIAFLLVTVSKSSLSFYLMSFGYLLAVTLFGGVIMPSFLISDANSKFKLLYYIIPNYYTNNVMSSAFNQGPGKIVNDISSFARGVLKNGIVIPGLKDLDPIHNPVVNAIKQFFGPWWAGGGTMTQLKSEWSNVITPMLSGQSHAATVYANAIYNILATPGQTTFGLNLGEPSWHQLLVDVLGAKKADPLFTGKTLTLIDTVVPIVLSDPIIGSLSSYILNHNFDEITAWLPIQQKAHFSYVIYLLMSMEFNNGGKHFVKPEFFTPTLAAQLSPLLDKLGNMFKIPFDLSTSGGIADLMAPWGESALFLGISIYFFKWS